jgi:RNA polymerase sigma factor (sigma-70 family)
VADSHSPNTSDLQYWVSELQGGRSDAAEPTFRKIVAQVERLSANMFAKFPRVGRFVDVDDVVQNSLIRLLAAFRQVRPQSTRHFYAVTNELIRRELLDLVKHYYGPHGHGTHLTAVPVGEASGEYTPPAPADADLDQWATLHGAIDRLPSEQREVMGLTLYHGWSQADIADLFGVSVRTIQRWQAEAVEQLRKSGAWK